MKHKKLLKEWVRQMAKLYDDLEVSRAITVRLLPEWQPKKKEQEQ